MLNKKGFTIAEVLVSFSLVALILASIITTTLYYRDRLKQEEIVSQLNDFRNNIIKTVYDDIIDNNVVKVEKCIGIEDCVNFIDSNNVSHVFQLVVISEAEETPSLKKGTYVYYNNIKYRLPDSDLIREYKSKDDGENEVTLLEPVCTFTGGIDVDQYENKIYKVKATFRHNDIDLQYDLLFVVG